MLTVIEMEEINRLLGVFKYAHHEYVRAIETDCCDDEVEECFREMEASEIEIKHYLTQLVDLQKN